jgi:hypothetical protein
MKRCLVIMMLFLFAISSGGKVLAAGTEERLKALEEKMGVMETKAPGLGVNLSGFVDVYYNYNFNRPASQTNLINGTSRNFDTRENQFSLNLLEVVLQKTAEPVGFRLDLDFGPTTDLVHGADPIGLELVKHIQQAYVTYTVPVGSGLTVDFGKFVTHQGAEVIESKDNWNYSRSLLFSYAIPYYHAGLRAMYHVTDQFYVMGLLVNGINNLGENNSGKSIGLQVGFNPIPSLGIIQNWIGGPEPQGALPNNKEWRHILDTIVTLAVSDQLSLMANYDYGWEKLIATGDTMVWTGVALYAKYQLNDQWAFSPRVEWYDDRDDFTVGASDGKKKLYEATLTAEYKVGNLIIRPEYRHDWSTDRIFESKSGMVAGTLKKSSDTVLIGAVYSF